MLLSKNRCENVLGLSLFVLWIRLSLLGMRWRNLHYYDPCTPMGCSSSCNTFETLSTAMEWFAQNKLRISRIIHLLDDFLIIAQFQSFFYSRISYISSSACVHTLAFPSHQRKHVVRPQNCPLLESNWILFLLRLVCLWTKLTHVSVRFLTFLLVRRWHWKKFNPQRVCSILLVLSLLQLKPFAQVNWSSHCWDPFAISFCSAKSRGQSWLKAGVHINLTEILGSLKRDWKGKKVMEHHQTVADLTMAPNLLGNCLVCIYQFLTSNSNFKTTPNLQNFLFP